MVKNDLLKIKIEKGENLEKQQTSFSNSLGKLFQEAKDNGILRIILYPSLENIISSLILFNVSLNLSVKPSISIRLNPPQKINEPTILIGYSNLNYKTSDISSALISLAHEINSVPVGNSTFVEINGSIGSGIYLALKGSDIINVRPEYAILSMASSYASKYVDNAGKFYSLDELVVNRIISNDSNLKMETITGLKIFRPLSMDFCKSLSITLNPIYLTLSNEDVCEKHLRENGLEGLINSNIGKIDDETMKNLIISIINLMKNISKRNIDPYDYAGAMEISTARIVMEDPREVMYSIMLLMDTMGFDSVVGLISDYENEYPPIIHHLKYAVNKSVDVILNNRFSKVNQINFGKVYTVNDDNLPIGAIQRQLKILGLIEKDAILGYLDNGILKLPVLSFEESMGYNSASRFVQTFKADFDGDFIWVKIA
ncbi:hypothetical protein [Caldisphaera sp.]|uniref:hypothetical protein n=1 Tax=Caldisphaera sp. TaxID=2060322 RepID=UPI00397B2725